MVAAFSSDSCLSRSTYLNALTVLEILHELRDKLDIPHSCWGRKSLLIDYVLTNAPEPIATELEKLGWCKVFDLQVREKRKGKFESSHGWRCNVCRRLNDGDCGNDEQNFLVLPSEDAVHSCSRRFYMSMNQAALQCSMCAVCTRECGVMDEETILVPLSNLPNATHLRPTLPHEAQEFFKGLILETAGIIWEETGDLVSLCSQCLCHLQDAKLTGPPPLSLANGLWIGNVPWQLQILLFAEQLFVTLLYPHIYVFKVFPKKLGGVHSMENLQRGMHGNVSMYQLNMEVIESMISGNLMLRPPEILASLVTVAFIGDSRLPKHWMGKIFQVQWQAITKALQWLKDNNSDYYGDIVIDTDRLCRLPDDDIPPEIMMTVHQTTDNGVMDQESAGYIPQDEILTVENDGSEGKVI